MDAMSQLDTANGGGVLKAFMLHKCSSNILERVSSIRKTGTTNTTTATPQKVLMEFILNALPWNQRPDIKFVS